MTLVARIRAKSRKRGKFYDVDCQLDDELLRITCDCSAGEVGKICNHKLAVLTGDIDILLDSGQVAELERVHELVAKTEYQKLVEEVGRLMDELARRKEQLAAAAEELGDALARGMLIR